MSDVLDYKVHGDDVQFVQITLDPGETVIAEVGTLFLKDKQIKMTTGVDGGIGRGIGRIFTGESFFITSFTNTDSEKRRQVFFSAPYLGKIIPLDLSEVKGEFLCQKDSFLCAAKGTDIKVAFTKKIGAGFFGGEGFILQKLQGDGLAFLHAGGSIVKMNLAEGQSIQVDTGCVVGFESSVDYSIEGVGGIKNALFAGQGFFLTTLTGAGTVYLQSLPFSKMADKVISAAGFSGRSGSTQLGGIGDLASIAGKIIK